MTLFCVIEVGHPKGTPATWVNVDHPEQTVCDRHKGQYEDSADDYCIHWAKIVQETPRSIKAMLRTVKDGGKHYQCLAFICPGCKAMNRALGRDNPGLHMLPVNTDETSPNWEFDGDLKYPTLNPSILTGKDTPNICHSYLKVGVFQFLDDCTHELRGYYVDMPDLPQWFLDEGE